MKKKDMKRNKQRNKKDNYPPSEFQLFTGGKRPELAIYYNLALDHLKKFIGYLENKPVELGGGNFKLSNDENYLRLMEYLWKGVSTFEKNSNGSFLTGHDKRIIDKMIVKLNNIRNFHSHIWHDNAVLQFSEELKNFIEIQYEIALKETSRLENVSGDLFYNEVKPKYKLFQKHNRKFFITQEGRLFFLSFFLNTGNMNALLQQTKGSKGNYLPEHRFKRKAYTYFCHREGATWFNPILSNDQQELLSIDEQGERHYSQQGMKIFNYLNDQPLYFMNSEFMPLWFHKDGMAREVNSIKDLLFFIRDKNVFSFLEFDEKDYSIEKQEAEKKRKKERDKLLKNIEDKQRIGAIDMKFLENDDYRFEISYPTLYQITLECYFDNTRIETFIKVLRSLMDRRRFLFESLTTSEADKEHYFERIERQYFYPRVSPKEKARKEGEELGKSEAEIIRILDTLQEDIYTIEELAHFPIGANAKTIGKLERWKKALEKDKDEKGARYRATNLFRPYSAPFEKKKGNYGKTPPDTMPQPILVHLAEFYKGMNQKPRKGDQFLRWAAQYLMDFDLCSDWEFAYEDYITEQKPGKDKTTGKTRIKNHISYGKKIPENNRLKLMKGHLLFRLPKHSEAIESEEFYYFMVGKKAMVYILNWLIISKNKTSDKNLNDFPQILKEDLNKIEKHGKEVLVGLELYEYHEKNKDNAFASTLPKFKLGLSTKKEYDRETAREKVGRKIEELQKLMDQVDLLNRNELNSNILKTYQLFDFSQTKSRKFLRKNEYELMSVVHYMRNQKNNDAKYYLDKKFKVNGGMLKDRIPRDIYEFIINSKSLKDLFIKVVNDRIVNLELAYDQLANETTELNEICRNCPYLKKLTQKPTPEEREEGVEYSYPFLPIYIHPNLVLKYFDREGFLMRKYHPSRNNPDEKYTNLYFDIRKNRPIKEILNGLYYENIWEEKILLPLKNIPKTKHPLLKKLKNWYHRYRLHTHTEDILLYSIGLQYLERSNKELVNHLQNFRVSQQTELTRLYRRPIIKELMEGKKGTGVFISFRLHQTDDHFFKVEQKNFLDLSQHYLQRKDWEIAYYRDKKQMEIAKQYEALPEGSKEDPIPIGHLLQERKIIGQTNIEVAGYLLRLEKEWAYQLAGKGSEWAKQKTLIEIYKSTQNKDQSSGNLVYLPFKTIRQRVIPEFSSELEKVRNTVLHNLIPEKPYIPYMGVETPGNKFFEILHIEDRIGKDKSIPTGYEQDS